MELLPIGYWASVNSESNHKQACDAAVLIMDEYESDIFDGFNSACRYAEILF